MYRYPGNHVDSGIVTVPRKLKTRPGAPETHLAYITPDEEKILQQLVVFSFKVPIFPSFYELCPSYRIH